MESQLAWKVWIYLKGVKVYSFCFEVLVKYAKTSKVWKTSALPQVSWLHNQFLWFFFRALCCRVLSVCSAVSSSLMLSVVVLNWRFPSLITSPPSNVEHWSFWTRPRNGNWRAASLWMAKKSHRFEKHNAGMTGSTSKHFHDVIYFNDVFGNLVTQCPFHEWIFFVDVIFMNGCIFRHDEYLSLESAGAKELHLTVNIYPIITKKESSSKICLFKLW